MPTRNTYRWYGLFKDCICKGSACYLRYRNPIDEDLEDWEENSEDGYEDSENGYENSKDVYEHSRDDMYYRFSRDDDDTWLRITGDCYGIPVAVEI